MKMVKTKKLERYKVVPVKTVEVGKPIRISGWALVHVDTREGVISGEAVYPLFKNTGIHPTGGVVPESNRDAGTVWCPMRGEEYGVRQFGLRWVKLDSEGEYLF